MSDTSLAIPFSLSSSKGRFLLLKQKGLPDDELTIDEVADAIDDMFGFELCVEEQTEDTFSTEEEGLTEAEQAQADYLVEKYSAHNFLTKSGGWFEIDCSGLDLQPIGLIVQVHRSHDDIEYTLRSTTGSINNRIIVDETINISESIKKANGFVIDYFILDDFEVSWAGRTGPTIHRDNSTLYWDESHTGTLEISFRTRYDEYTIIIEGEETGTLYEPELDYSCTALAFWEKKVETLDLEVPEGTLEDNEWKCPRTELETHHPVSCFEIINNVLKHPCTNEVLRQWTSTPVTPCPADAEEKSFYTANGWFYITDRRDELHYIGYPSDLWYTREMRQELEEDFHDLEFFEEHCCKDYPGPPRCQTFYGVYGGSGINGGKEQYINMYGRDTVFHPIRPKEGYCGQLITEYLVRQKDCCEGSIEITPHEDNPETISDDYFVELLVTGGARPYHWHVGGGGPGEDGVPAVWFYEDAEGYHNTITTQAGMIVVFSGQVCGTVTITVWDDCEHETSFGLRAIDGQWVLITDQVEKDMACSAMSGFSGDSYFYQAVNLGGGGTAFHYDVTGIVGGYKVITYDLQYTIGTDIVDDDMTWDCNENIYTVDSYEEIYQQMYANKASAGTPILDEEGCFDFPGSKFQGDELTYSIGGVKHFLVVTSLDYSISMSGDHGRSDDWHPYEGGVFGLGILPCICGLNCTEVDQGRCCAGSSTNFRYRATHQIAFLQTISYKHHYKWEC